MKITRKKEKIRGGGREMALQLAMPIYIKSLANDENTSTLITMITTHTEAKWSIFL